MPGTASERDGPDVRCLAAVSRANRPVDGGLMPGAAGPGQMTVDGGLMPVPTGLTAMTDAADAAAETWRPAEDFGPKGGNGMYYYYDYTWIVLLPAIIFTFICQSRINSAYRTYSNVENSRHITGAEAARRMMDANGLSGVSINILNGSNSLNNYYDPRTKSLNLSRQVYSSDSIASMCIACHEVGHAIQDAQHYAPLAMRNGIVPAVNLAQMASWPLIFFGLLATRASAYGSMLFQVGVLCFLFVIFFHLITLPVEFNASNRALEQMRVLGMVEEEDYIGSRAVLKAAAMTYVAALATAVASLLRVFLIAGRRN